LRKFAFIFIATFGHLASLQPTNQHLVQRLSRRSRRR